MLTHHEPSTGNIDYASLSPEQRATFVQSVIRRARAERAKAVADMVKGLVRLLASWRAGRGGDAQGTPPNYARHA